MNDKIEFVTILSVDLMSQIKCILAVRTRLLVTKTIPQPSRGQLQTLSIVGTNQTEGKMKLHRPHILCKGEGSHYESPDDDVMKVL